MAPFTESLVDAAGVRVHLRRGGSGDPLLILHGELGVPGARASTARCSSTCGAAYGSSVHNARLNETASR
jgi:hypothetical protein